jgi:F0F1-type ATP synthase membrane subunit c/vacuolar-type H+-ATPase subunit K
MWEVAMKAFGAGIIVLVALYLADQALTQGKYTAAAQRMAMQIRHSMGI